MPASMRVDVRVRRGNAGIADDVYARLHHVLRRVCIFYADPGHQLSQHCQTGRSPIRSSRVLPYFDEIILLHKSREHFLDPPGLPSSPMVATCAHSSGRDPRRCWRSLERLASTRPRKCRIPCSLQPASGTVVVERFKMRVARTPMYTLASPSSGRRYKCTHFHVPCIHQSPTFYDPLV